MASGRTPIPERFGTLVESTTASLAFPKLTGKDVVREIFHKRAQQMLAQAIQEQVIVWIEEPAELRDARVHH